MTAQSARKKKQKHTDNTHSSRWARFFVGLNAAGFVAFLAGLGYHIYNLTVNYGYSDLHWSHFLILAAGYALFLTWHYRIVFVRAYRAIEGWYLHLAAVTGLMGFWWMEALFPVIEATHIQAFLLPLTLIWLVILLMHRRTLPSEGHQPDRTTDKQTAQQTSHPDITRLTDTSQNDTRTHRHEQSPGTTRRKQQ